MSHIATCPHCSTRMRVPEGITDKTLICPHCLADVDSVRMGSRTLAPQYNTDVKRDLSTGSIILLVLIGLCVLGIALSFFAGSHNRRDEGATILSLFAIMGFFAALDVLVSIAIIVWLKRWGLSGLRSPSAGRIIGIVFLSLGSIVAVVIFFFFTCFALVADF